MFRITSAPEKYQKIISDVIQGCNSVANIADGLIIYGSDLEEHERNLHAVLQRLKGSGLTLNGDKCQFRLPKLTFFGHELSSHGITPSEEKIAAVVNARVPRNVSEIRSFVQLVQYSAKFVPNFAQVAEPLRKQLRKGEPFVWDTEQQESFETLKQLMSTAKTLAYFRNDCQTRIVADAGPEGLGAVLLQLQDNGWRAVLYASTNLSEVERRYAQTEKEALSLVWARERFNIYVYVANLNWRLITNLYSAFSASLRNHQQELNGGYFVYSATTTMWFTVPVRQNIADALSRLNQAKPKDCSSETEDFVRFVVQESGPVAVSPREIERESEHDP